MKIIRTLLFPFSLLYGLVVVIRNLCYQTGVFKSQRFTLPIIVVGNLEVGGSGKTPITEYLTRLLKHDFKIATLSRGYGRNTKGFRIANKNDDASSLGDEPYQYYNKFADVTVAIGENRVAAVQKLKDSHDVILLDDAFQHRHLEPGLSVLLFDYNTIYKPRFLLPTGNYREPFVNRKRADVLMVTKTPKNIDQNEKNTIGKILRPNGNQQLVFSYLKYGKLIPFWDDNEQRAKLDKHTDVLLLTGIARPLPMLEKVRETAGKVIHLKYPDHYTFSEKNIAKIAEAFNQMNSAKKLIITTEKDAMRLKSAKAIAYLQHFPIYYWPIEACMQQPEKAIFDQLIIDYVRQGTGNR